MMRTEMRVYGQIISHSTLPKLETPSITQPGLIHFPDLSTIEPYHDDSDEKQNSDHVIIPAERTARIMNSRILPASEFHSEVWIQCDSILLNCNRLGDRFTPFFPSSPPFYRWNGDDNGGIEILRVELR
jgi:hypothetical protein